MTSHVSLASVRWKKVLRLHCLGWITSLVNTLNLQRDNFEPRIVQMLMTLMSRCIYAEENYRGDGWTYFFLGLASHKEVSNDPYQKKKKRGVQWCCWNARNLFVDMLDRDVSLLESTAVGFKCEAQGAGKLFLLFRRFFLAYVSLSLLVSNLIFLCICYYYSQIFEMTTTNPEYMLSWRRQGFYLWVTPSSMYLFSFDAELLSSLYNLNY